MKSNIKYISLFLSITAILIIAGYVISISKKDNSINMVKIDNNNLPKSNSWFSSAYSFPSQPIFAHPFAFKIYEQGIGLSNPKVSASDNAIFGSYVEECILKTPIDSILSIEYGDWHTIFNLNSNNLKTKLIVSQDSPIIYIQSNENLEFECSNTNKFVYQANNDWSRIILMPDDANQDVISELKNSDWIIPHNTLATYNITKNKVETVYNTDSELRYKLIYPHQINNLKNNFEKIGKYNTQLGEILLVKSEDLKTSVKNPNLELNFDEISDSDNRSQLIQSIESDINDWIVRDISPGVYFRGTDLGALSTLVQLSQQYETESKELILKKLEAELLNSIDSFEYDDETKMIIATNDEFGNKEGNDHHFHYGYYIRAAAVLTNYKPELSVKIEDKVNRLVEDIASINNSDFPRLRNYSVYEGHSWASGWAPFGDGNNQESMSEALNAWYAIKIWGDATNNQVYADLGTWLYSQELEGAKSYWYGINNPFPDGYNHHIASIIWGGKRDYGTWFSGEDTHIYGIQWLPINPASDYYFRSVATLDQINELKGAYPSSYDHEWGDLLLAYESTINPDQAAENLNKIENFGGIKLKSLLLQTVYSNLER